MKYVVASNRHMFEVFLDIFASGKRDCYRFVSDENWRGIGRDTIFILFEDYENNDAWQNTNLRYFVNTCLSVYFIQHMDWVI